MEDRPQRFTRKQQLFCEEFIKEPNATQAAINAGYSKKTAFSIGCENLKKPYIKAYIEKQMEEKDKKLIADQNEILKYLTSVMRGETKSEIVVIEGDYEGGSSARRMLKAPDEKERLKAAELLGKRYGLYTDKVDVNGAVPVVITGEDELED